jgi:hypothetical protein
MRRRLLLLSGLGAAVAVKVATDAAAPAQAAGRVVGAPLGYDTNPGYDAPSDGVQGYAVGANNAGTFGRNNDLNGVGVYGAAPSGVAVHGESSTGTAVGARTATGSAIVAVVTGASASSIGVNANAINGPGVSGYSTNSYGVYGISANSWAMVASSPNGLGLYAQGGGGTGTAAIFSGNVVVQGSLTVTGSAPKSAAVPHPDGSQRRMYCMESPESWFEDFGQGTLVAGRALVTLDPDFDAVVKGDNYHVFLTEYADLGGLYVANRAPHQFEVRSRSGAVGAFGYRVLAKRRDIAGPRMEKVTIPNPPDLRQAPVPQPGAPTDTSPSPGATSR